MAAPEDQQGVQTPEAENSSSPEAQAAETKTSNGYYDDGYPSEESTSTAVTAPEPKAAEPPAAPPPPAPPAEEANDDEEGMARMSFLEHLEELRSRIIKALLGIGVAFFVSLTFTNQLWNFVATPAIDALRQLGYPNPTLAQIKPMETFNVIWVKLPILCAIFLASPWVLYQVWAFIAPGLYKRERRWAAPFILCSAGLFIAGGVFAYFVAFRFGLAFLLSIGRGNYVTPMVSITEYFDLFVNVILGVGLVFELPVLIFFLTLLRVVNPGFLIRNSRYAILAIFALAALVTPTPDIFNLTLFATPMVMLFFAGVFASYLLVLHRENRRLPWRKILYVLAVVAVIIAGVLYLAVTKYGYRFVPYWPFMTQ
jgi:sec-independent protein translocase protein TatC